MKIPTGLALKALATKESAPTIMFGAGLVGMVGSTVLACRGTLRLEEVLQKTQSDLQTARDMEHEEYSETDRKQDIAKIYTRSVLDIGKLYGPSIVLGVASIGLLAKSHITLTERNAALTAAYVGIDRAFKEYRNRVVDKYGEEQDREFRFPTEKVKEQNPATGRDHTVERVTGNLDASMYARMYDSRCDPWQPDQEYNIVWLKNQQNWFNDKLQMRGHVLLNEVYDALDMPRTVEGAVVGWKLWGEGDNYVDFGLFDNEGAIRSEKFISKDGAILLDFNVDGLVYHKIDEDKEGVRM